MKKIFLIKFTLLAFCLLSYSQNTEEIYFKKNNPYIGIKRIVYTYNNKWKSVYFYNKQGLPERQINYFKNNKRAEYCFKHVLTDTTLVIKEKENKDPEGAFHIRRYLYDKNGNCVKMEVFSSSNINTPLAVADSFIYNDDNLLSEYKRSASINWKYKYFYDNKKQKIRELKFNSSFKIYKSLCC